MLSDYTCYFLTFGFDDKNNDKKIKSDVLALVSVCDEYNVPLVL